MNTKMGRTVCTHDRCAACMACVDACQHGAITVEDTLVACNAMIDSDKCVECGACQRVCPQLSPVELRAPIAWQQGWASNPAERAASSSGGLATAISRSFIDKGGLVCSCRQHNGEFTFELTDDANKLEVMRGSKYVKSNPAGSYRRVREVLRTGHDVLFLGLPCQVAAVRNYVGKLEERLYTIDLICHGTPSFGLLRRYLEERNQALGDKLILDFRKKIQFQLRWRGAETGLTGRGMDRYTIAFLEGMSYTENCYSCPYACRERTSDLTLGDSWGTELVNEKLAGVSLALVNTEKGFELVRGAELTLLPADESSALESNAQLSRPTMRPDGRENFFNALASGATVDEAVFKQRPRLCLECGVKNMVKGLLIKLGLM